jgi:hypothetical protein
MTITRLTSRNSMIEIIKKHVFNTRSVETVSDY